MIIDSLKLSGRVAGFVCHESGPKYWDDDDDKDKPYYNTLKYKGGPNLFPGTMIGPTCAEMDIVLRVVVRPSLTSDARVYRTAVEERWEGKFRDFRVKAEEPFGLRALLLKAGYSV